MSEPSFLSLEEVLAIHRQQLELWGGSDGIINEATLLAALGQAGAVYSFVDDADLYDMAAAYAFSMSEGQPFVDGNKRTGLNAALLFLELNGADLPADDEGQLYAAMMLVANGKLTRAGLADVLRLGATC
jgi:death on curing protein